MILLEKMDRDCQKAGVNKKNNKLKKFAQKYFSETTRVEIMAEIFPV